jgi:hypothetical protein
MKLKVNDIKYGLIPFGPAGGTRALMIDIGENDAEWKDDWNLYKDLKSKIIDLKLEVDWINAMNGSLSTFIIFKGGVIEKPEHYDEWDKFHRELSRESYEAQVALKIAPDKVRPPYCIWVGIPKEYTSKKSFYEYFNNIYALIIDENYNHMALQEIINHVFSCVSILAEKDKIKIANEVRKTFNLSFTKMNIVGNKLNNLGTEATEYCLTYGIRYYFKSEGPNFLELI